MYSLNSSGPGLEKVVHTRRISCLSGWPREFGALNTSPHSWIFTSVSVASSLRSYLFTSATVRIGVPIAPKYGTKPTRYVTLHFRDQRSAASLRHRHRAEITSLCVNRSPIRYDFCASERAIQYSANIAYTVTTCTPRAPILQQLTVEPLYDSHFLWDRDGLHGRLKKRGEKKPKISLPFALLPHPSHSTPATQWPF